MKKNLDPKAVTFGVWGLKSSSGRATWAQSLWQRPYQAISPET